MADDKKPNPATKPVSVEVSPENTINKLPDYHLSVRLKYMKLGYHYLVTHAMYLLLTPLPGVVSFHVSTISVENIVHLGNYLNICLSLIIFLATLYLMSRPRKVYLVNFACYKPEPAFNCSKEELIERSRLSGILTEESLVFMRKVSERSGLGQKTSLPPAIMQIPPDPSLIEARKEAETVMFGAIDELLAKRGVQAQDIGILVVNCGLFNPTPSHSAMVVNHYKVRSNILSYNLGRMGCSAGEISNGPCQSYFAG